ncbi:HAD family hydrolase [Psychroflexus lacisalsi]|jgi:Cof subfamily protein (haloacid dehalogenase superfamily)|uniref:Cof-type HAD-IIB family hydrolase n=1 Tax=Psychroflexus lacisalsi TaxID=503928 RepID=A0ABN1KDB7_9FLAO|nr:HAD family hydrolase [Psychroflexus lacisalsi]MBZ9620203.1 Cof-type HAD-IIB family hydrolase [Psychroflexus lacisalsi]
MDFSKIKLVVSDMDGTLLNSEHQVSSLFLSQFDQLKRNDIHFVAASGRQFQSILEKLSSIKEDISVIAENGAIMMFNKETKVLLKLNRDEILECITHLRKVDDSYIVLCGRKTAYIESNDSEFITTLRNYYSEVSHVKDLTQVEDDDFVKIAVFHFKSSEKYIYPKVIDITDRFQVTVSSQNWVDISHKETNKSYALKQIQKHLNITPEETMVFGDYNNDIEMLKLAQFSYAMSNAHPNVKNVANYHTSTNDDFGVESVLKQLISPNS